MIFKTILRILMKNKEPYNIIFLDMDGVINNQDFITEWINNHPSEDHDRITFNKTYCLHGIYYIVPYLLERFNNLYNSIPNCKIVWSSSWRLGNRDSKLFIEALYNGCGFPKNSFLSYTPYLNGAPRADEITKWIKSFSDIYNINKCAIIDDDSDAEINHQINKIECKFFKTNPKEGLTENIASEIKKYFS